MRLASCAVAPPGQRCAQALTARSRPSGTWGVVQPGPQPMGTSAARWPPSAPGAGGASKMLSEPMADGLASQDTGVHQLLHPGVHQVLVLLRLRCPEAADPSRGMPTLPTCAGSMGAEPPAARGGKPPTSPVTGGAAPVASSVPSKPRVQNSSMAGSTRGTRGTSTAPLVPCLPHSSAVAAKALACGRALGG